VVVEIILQGAGYLHATVLHPDLHQGKEFLRFHHYY
jgi:hypothetical protein